jgi:NADPH2:quinone reductase
MKIKAVGINRAETLHRMGKYPINKEVEKYLGLEASGEVIDPATKYIFFTKYREVLFNGIALLSGGSYAQYATIPKTHVMKLPQNLSFV